MTHRTLKFTSLVLPLIAGISPAAQAQDVYYEFSSGPDGFSWPTSPTGLTDGNSFFTPDGIDIYNDTGNTVFFDQQYQTLGNGSLINGDALWGNPLDLGSGFVVFDLYNFTPGDITEVSFDFAWSEAGVTDAPEFLSIYFEDSEGRANFNGYQVSQTFPGLGGGLGREEFMQFDTNFLVDDFDNIDGGNFVDIAYMEIYVDEITFGGNSSEFAIDNFATNGTGGPGNGEVFPSVNGGQFDVTGSTNGTTALRGTGTAGIGLEVTNGSGNNTTYSIQLQPGGDLSAGTLVLGDTILDGQSVFAPNIATIDRSLPAGDYTSQVLTVNNGDPLDPDNLSSLSIDLFDAPLLSGTATAVDVSLGQSATLANAAGPFRASVKFTDAQTATGPFTLASGFEEDTPVKPGESAQASFVFNRYGQLSGTRTGQYIATVEMTAYTGISNDIEIFLAFAEPVPNQVWDLTYNHTNATTDNANISPGASYFHIIGVNTFDVAATLEDGTSSTNQNVSMQITPNPDPGSAELIGDAVDLTFGGGAGDIYVLQLTYLEGGVPAGSDESDLELGWFNTVSGEWESAVAGNSGGTPTFFNGAYADYLGTLGGGVLDAGDLGVYGYDLFNNHVWAVLDHASVFGVGVLGGTIPGDLNGDGFVGLDDLDIILQNWNQTIPPGNPLADPTGDNFVGLADLDILLNNWNAGTPPGSASIPEPAGLTLLGLGGLSLLRRR